MLKVLGIYIAATLACVVLVAPFVDFAASWLGLIGYNLPIFLLSLVVCAAFIVLYSFLQDFSARTNLLGRKRFLALSLCMGLLLFIAQLYLQKSAGFVCGWDVGTITQVGERAPSDTSALARYLSIYPNQQFLYGLFRKLAKLASLADVSAYRTLVCCSCLCVTASIVLATAICHRLFGEVQAIAFQVFASLFIGLNGWVLVPYSDTFGMLFTSAALWLYVIPRKQSVRLLGLTAVSILGYMVKPTAIFLLFAIICLDWIPGIAHSANELIKSNRHSRSRKLTLNGDVAAASTEGDCQAPNATSPSASERNASPIRGTLVALLKVAVPIALGVILAAGIGQYVKGNYLTIDPNASYGMTHYLSMGINPSSKGFVSGEEGWLSGSISDPSERRSAQLQLWKKHLKELGPVGLLKIWFEKNLTNYADGSFAWKREVIGGSKNWAGWQIPTNNKTISIYGDSLTVKNWYGIVDEDQRDGAGIAYGWYCQLLWFAVLLGCAASALRHARSMKAANPGEPSQSTNHICATMALTLIFLSGFLLIFECRARYLFLFMPYYTLFAIDGLIGKGSAGEWFARKVSKLHKDLNQVTRLA